MIASSATASKPMSLALFQMTSSDKDFRFMATNDLMAELQKDSIKLDDDSERKVTIMTFSFYHSFVNVVCSALFIYI